MHEISIKSCTLSDFLFLIKMQYANGDHIHAHLSNFSKISYTVLSICKQFHVPSEQ